MRKVLESQNGTRQKERIYVGGYEIFREYNGATGTRDLERESRHVMDDKQRIALVETATEPTEGQPLIRYQLGNHVGSASVELAENGALISYEEYHPYGTTADPLRGENHEQFRSTGTKIPQRRLTMLS